MGWKTAWAAMAVVVACGSTATAARASDCVADLPQQLRVMDCDVATAVANAIRQSTSLQAVVGRIGDLKGIVYVTAPVDVTRKTTLAGGFFHRIVSVGETRMLWIALAHEPRYSDHSMGILGHELRHALEVLEATDVRTEADVDALYRRIGYARSGGIVETDAALAMGQQVERELTAARRIAHRN